LWADGKRPTIEEIGEAKDAINKIWDGNQTEIGDVGNCEGGVSVMENDGAYFWAIENYDGWTPEEITKDLYDALLTFNTNQENLPDSTNGYTYYPQEHKTIFNTKEK
jgi:hypothetical protein